MSTLKRLLLIASIALLSLSLGQLAFHYVAITEQYFRIIMM
jgi:hypothetical protein